MTSFASVVLFKREGVTWFKPPRKERPEALTQARKAAMRFWRGNLSEGDALVRVILCVRSPANLRLASVAAAPADETSIGCASNGRSARP